MKFTKGLFWDVDESTFDYQRHASHIIPRVFMKGRLNDILLVLRYYGKEEVKKELLQTRYLDKKALSFSAHYFSVPKENFRCFKLSQSIPQHWNC